MILLILTAACSNVTEEKVVARDQDVETLYNQGAAALDTENYVMANFYFEEVERQHPYSIWATRAQLMAAYASYKNINYDEAILALDRFIELHPGNKDVDYALYLQALSYYEQISDVRRDQEMTQKALQTFNTLIRRFPDSKYARDAQLKKDLTIDHLAGKEMEIGRYYLSRGFVQGSVNRFRTVIQNYETTTHTPEALHRLVEAYVILGLDDEATRVAAVLGYNFPGSAWYQASYKLLDEESRRQLIEDRDVIDRTIESLFNPN